MTLLELLKRAGRLEISLDGEPNGDRVAVNVGTEGGQTKMDFEDIKFNTGGSLTLVYLQPENPTA